MTNHVRRGPLLLQILLLGVLACGGAGKGPPAPNYNLDTDKDGVADSSEQSGCVGQVEDIDGWQDTDGCPDLDNDTDGLNDDVDQCPGVSGKSAADGSIDPSGCPGVAEARQQAQMTASDLDKDGDNILDVDDRCATAAEDFDNFEDTDGCPEDDNDQDGIPDAAEAPGCNGRTRCTPGSMNVWCEDKAGSKPMDGCRAPDTDSDGVIDDNDQCPFTKGVAGARGCPDRDGDGVADTDKNNRPVDRCPNMADTSGDGDGCPGTDADSDGIANAKDQCPEVPEVKSFTDRNKDGCPN